MNPNSSNDQAGFNNGYYSEACRAVNPQNPHQVCSLAKGHRGKLHKAYEGHKTQYRDHFIAEWSRALAEGRKVTDQDVEAAMASILGTAHGRHAVQTPVQVAPPQDAPSTAIRMLRRENEALRQENADLRDALRACREALAHLDFL